LFGWLLASESIDATVFQFWQRLGRGYRWAALVHRLSVIGRAGASRVWFRMQNLEEELICMAIFVLPPVQLEPATLVSAALSTEEKVRLHQLERVVETNFRGFLEAGKALLEIRSSRLYRERYPNFEQYVRERWGLSAHRANELCRGVTTAELLLSTTGAPGTDTPLPADVPELVLRPLTRLAEPELRAQVWRLVSLVSPEGRTPTHTAVAKVVRLVREAMRGKNGDGGSGKAVLPEREQMFIQPIQRLASVDAFDPVIACLHIRSFDQAQKVMRACRVVAARCREIERQLIEKF
jgi:hypothetical protein